jgi:phospholipid/cholesterol/gamma-HCH transport system permease protein
MSSPVAPPQHDGSHSKLPGTGRFATIGRATVFSLRTLMAMPMALLRPSSIIAQSVHLGLGSLPLVVAAGACIGVVAWIQARTLLSDFGSVDQLPSVVAAFIVLGIGPVFTALVTAGQVGARLGAELAAMTINEQVDALHAMGLSATRHLVTGRVWACVLMLPLLTITVAYTGMGAACLAEVLGGDLNASTFWSRSLELLTLERVVPATLSSVVFGLVIGLVGCWFGLHPAPGTEGVGQASTRSVVVSMLMILVVNVIWVRVTELVLRG